MAVTESAAVTTIKDDNFVSCWALIRERHDLRQRETIVACLALASTEIPARGFDITVTGEVEQTHIGIVSEQLAHRLLKFRSRHALCRSGSDNDFRAEIDR